MTPKDILLASRLADAAGHAIRPFFRSEFTSESKSDASPVTEADRAAEQAIRDILDAECPHDAIIGEEFGVKAGDSKRTWVLDPIDGTIDIWHVNRADERRMACDGRARSMHFW